MQARFFPFFGAVLALVLCGAAAHPKAIPTPKSETLRAFVTLMLDQAPVNFANMRGAVKDKDVYQVRYSTKPQFNKTCVQCIIVDQFAWPGHVENWSLQQRWTGTDTEAQVISTLTAQLTPVLKGYTLTKTGTKDYPTYTWRNGAKGLWVSVETFNGGFTPSIGQDLSKPVHVLKAPTAADIASLRNGVTNFVSLGVGPASGNFSTLRGTASKDILGSPTYQLSVSFGSMLRECSITDNTVDTLKLGSDFSPKWNMDCSTVPMVGGKEIESQVEAAMAAALPSGFTATTDKYLGLDDYRWDNTATSVAIDIDSFSSYTLPNGLVSYGVGIIHFLPAPAST